ncbi:MAG: hypothetical protein K0R78_719 [Pelosinus sp.]|jgi:hypothetical protein|nr:hypothetical protein [Pelosinus sp.]
MIFFEIHICRYYNHRALALARSLMNCLKNMGWAESVAIVLGSIDMQCTGHNID